MHGSLTATEPVVAPERLTCALSCFVRPPLAGRERSWIGYNLLYRDAP